MSPRCETLRRGPAGPRVVVHLAPPAPEAVSALVRVMARVAVEKALAEQWLDKWSDLSDHAPSTT